MLWELRMSDLQPLLNAHPPLQHDLCGDVIQASLKDCKQGTACLPPTQRNTYLSCGVPCPHKI